MPKRGMKGESQNAEHNPRDGNQRCPSMDAALHASCAVCIRRVVVPHDGNRSRSTGLEMTKPSRPPYPKYAAPCGPTANDPVRIVAGMLLLRRISNMVLLENSTPYNMATLDLLSHLQRCLATDLYLDTYPIDQSWEDGAMRVIELAPAATVMLSALTRRGDMC